MAIRDGRAVRAVGSCGRRCHLRPGVPLVSRAGRIARILKPEGRLALIWNSRDAGDPLTAGYRQAILDVNGEHPAERREFDPASLSRSGLFLPHEYFEFPNSQPLELEGLIGRAMSASYVPKTGPPHRMLDW